MPDNIAIGSAQLGLLQRLKATLKEFLPAELITYGDEDYPLPAPERYIMSRTSPEDAFRRLNIDEVACWITKENSSLIDNRYSQSTTVYCEDRTTSMRITIIAKNRDGMNLPDDGDGDVLLEEEWMLFRAEKYKGALIDAITKNSEDAINLWEVYISEDNGDVLDLEFGKYSSATIVLECRQEVLVSLA